MALREIGSDFWDLEYSKTPEYNYFPDWKGEIISPLSGRTALDLIVKDIISERHFRRVYLPSYCCDSMVLPFLNNGVKVDFYKVFVDIDGCIDVEVNNESKCDAILIINYFGVIQEFNSKLIEFANKNNMLIIEDATHSIFSNKMHSDLPNYIFTSLRKWMAIPDGAFAAKSVGNFNVSLKSCTNLEFVQKRAQAFSIKKEYMMNGNGPKERYLNLYSEATSLLEKDYEMYPISRNSLNILAGIDIKQMINKRRENGSFLINQLSSISELSVPTHVIKEDETPLFIPIFLKNKVRNDLRNFLITQNIFCPVHWPIKPLNKLQEDWYKIYDQELSLVCDHRYGLEEMEKLSSSIIKFLKNI